jgi:uncharacterized protein YcgL (UPF0745 family)
MFVTIYKSPKREGMYLYVKKEQGINNIPEDLAELFGTPVLVTHMRVEQDKKFAKVKAADLLEAIKKKGFYLQIPDPIEDYKQYLVKQNDKLA